MAGLFVGTRVMGARVTFGAGWLLLAVSLGGFFLFQNPANSSPYAYITNQSDDTVSVINTTTGKVAATNA